MSLRWRLALILAVVVAAAVALASSAAYLTAERELRDAVQRLRELGNPWAEAITEVSRGRLAWLRGLTDDAQACFDRATAVAEAVGDQFTLSVAGNHQARLQLVRGDIDQPLPDISPSDPPVDVGQKAISYRSPLTPTRRPMAAGAWPTPFITATRDLPIWLRLVCAGDKPRNHTFTLHGFAWNAAPWVANGPQTGSVGAISAGFAQDLVMTPENRWDPGDHAYRSGAFRWAVTQGMWGILRIED